MSSNIVKKLFSNLKIPVMCAPMYIASNPKLVVAQCRSGIVGSFPAMNARGQLDAWLQKIKFNLGPLFHKKLLPPFAVNQIVHPYNKNLQEDMNVIIKHEVPIVITSLGTRREINDAVHSYGGIVLHDVTKNSRAREAISHGADGLIAIAAGAGGHAGQQSPFALMQEIREWYGGPVGLGGCISNGSAVLAAKVMGADFAYIGSPFLATKEANTAPEYKRMVVDCSAENIINTDFFTGAGANYLGPSIPKHVDINHKTATSRWLEMPKVWSEIWACGQGISNVTQIVTTNHLVRKWIREYEMKQKKYVY